MPVRAGLSWRGQGGRDGATWAKVLCVGDPGSREWAKLRSSGEFRFAARPGLASIRE